MKLDKNLLKGSIILLITFNLYNLFNFIFHFAMARMLSVSDYGILAAMFSIVYIVGIFSESIQTTITGYVAKMKNDSSELSKLLRRSTKKAFLLGALVLGIYLLIMVPLHYLIKIDYSLLAITGVMIILSFMLPVNRGFLQGSRRFTGLGTSMIVESVFKLVLAVFFVYIGWRVWGAVIGTINGLLISYLLSLVQLRNIRKTKFAETVIPGKKRNLSTFIAILTIMIFYSIDIIVARFFFNEEIAGAYAIASILSKTIFWGTQPISKAMFPLSSSTTEIKERKGLLLSSSLLLFFGIIVALAAFYYLPEYIVQIYSGKSVVEASSVLFILGATMSFISISNLILLYKVSNDKIKNSYIFPVIVIACQIILFTIFSNNIISFSMAFLGSSLILLIGSILFFNK